MLGIIVHFLVLIFSMPSKVIMIDIQFILSTHFLLMNITCIVYLHRNGITSMLQSTTKLFRNVERMYLESLHFQAIRGAYISSTNEQK